jgi:hypothetical protein
MRRRPLLLCAILVGLLNSCVLSPEISYSQLIDSVSSEHVLMRMPIGREALARDMISEMERCYSFMNKATGSYLPRKILINVNWELPDSSCNWRDAVITVGMNQPDKLANLNAILLHKAGREIARLGLLELSQGAEREDTEFLFEAMSEMLIHEYERSSRSLEAAWTISQLLDEMQTLGLSPQRSWSKFSGGKRCLRSAAPGITLLNTFRDLQGRDRPIKLFEALKRTSLTESLALAFKVPSTELETTWLKRVREYSIPDEITIAAEDAPELLKSESVPETGQPGTSLQLRFYLKDRGNNLLPDGVFVKDERTHRVMQAQAAAEKNAAYMMVTIPIEANCSAGQYNYQIFAADESGNLRRWNGSYTVVSR